MKKTLYAIVVLLIIGSYGCATRSGTKISLWPPDADIPKKSISIVIGNVNYNVNFRGILTGIVTEDDISSIGKEQTFKAYRESGLFSEIITEPTQADLQEINISYTYEGAGAGVLIMPVSLLSFTIIPMPTREYDVVVVTKMKDKEGNLLGEIHKSEKGTVWWGISALLGKLSNSPRSVITSALYDISCATVYEAYERGLLSKNVQH